VKLSCYPHKIVTSYLPMQVVELEDYILPFCASSNLARFAPATRYSTCLNDLLQGIRTPEPLPSSTPPVVLRSSKPSHIRLPTLFSRNSKSPRIANTEPLEAIRPNMHIWRIGAGIGTSTAVSVWASHQPFLARIPLRSHCLIARFIWPPPPLFLPQPSATRTHTQQHRHGKIPPSARIDIHAYLHISTVRWSEKR